MIELVILLATGFIIGLPVGIGIGIVIGSGMGYRKAARRFQQGFPVQAAQPAQK